jgi:hypothetical protein
MKKGCRKRHPFLFPIFGITIPIVEFAEIRGNAAFQRKLRKKNILKYLLSAIVLLMPFTIFTTVFHRILDFKNGAGFLSWPLYFFIQG